MDYIKWKIAMGNWCDWSLIFALDVNLMPRRTSHVRHNQHDDRLKGLFKLRMKSGKLTRFSSLPLSVPQLPGSIAAFE